MKVSDAAEQATLLSQKASELFKELNLLESPLYVGFDISWDRDTKNPVIRLHVKSVEEARRSQAFVNVPEAYQGVDVVWFESGFELQAS